LSFRELLATKVTPCGENDPSLWFADPEDPDEPHDSYAEAVALCQTCPFKRECLLEALQSGEQYGVWGGITPAQRQSMSRGRH
jgi:hypothetical protein